MTLNSASRKFQWIATFQSALYVTTGLWPLFHIESFMWVTGPKTDLWLVRTVGLLIAVIGAVLGDSAYRQSFPRQIILLAIGSAGALTVVDIFYSSTGVISPIYLLDAVVEIGIICAWLLNTRD